MSSRREAATGQKPRNKERGRGEAAKQPLSNLERAFHWPCPSGSNRQELKARDGRNQPTRQGVDRGRRIEIGRGGGDNKWKLALK